MDVGSKQKNIYFINMHGSSQYSQREGVREFVNVFFVIGLFTVSFRGNPEACYIAYFNLSFRGGIFGGKRAQSF